MHRELSPVSSIPFSSAFKSCSCFRTRSFIVLIHSQALIRVVSICSRQLLIVQSFDKPTVFYLPSTEMADILLRSPLTELTGELILDLNLSDCQKHNSKWILLLICWMCSVINLKTDYTSVLQLVSFAPKWPKDLYISMTTGKLHLLRRWPKAPENLLNGPCFASYFSQAQQGAFNLSKQIGNCF